MAGVGQVDAEVAPANGGREMPPEVGVDGGDLLDRALEPLGHRDARPLRMRGGPAPPCCRGELFAEGVELGAESLRVSQVVRLLGFLELCGEIRQAGAVLVARPGIEQRTRV